MIDYKFDNQGRLICCDRYYATSTVTNESCSTCGWRVECRMKYTRAQIKQVVE